MSRGRDVFSVRWALEYPADLEMLGMVEEKVDATLRRLRVGPFETERIMVAVLSVCEDVVVTLLGEDTDRQFRVDMTVFGARVHVRVRCALDSRPEGAAVGGFRAHGETARLLEMESLAIAAERMDEVEGEIDEDGVLSVTLVRNLPEHLRRDPPMYG